MADAAANFAASTVATAPSPATSGASLVVTTGEGAAFPAAPFNATIWPSGSVPTGANAEIVRVTARSTDTLTITRAQEGTAARTVAVGDLIAATVTKKTLDDLAGTNPWAARSATDAPQVVRGSAAGTSANLMDWQDQGGSVVASIGPTGAVLEGGRRLARLTSRLTSNATVASATQTSTGLTVTLLANKVYGFSITGAWSTSATASTWSPRMNFSGTVTSILATIMAGTNTTTYAGSVQVANATAFTTITAAITGNLPWRIDGTLVVGASGGNLVMEHARAAGTGTITVNAGTFMAATELA